MEPLSKLVADPVVAEHKRVCPDCDTKLTGLIATCPSCGKVVTFAPSLAPGVSINDQYEIRGVIAHGGVGWIYLAWDRILSRWVVLKGLLHTGDEASVHLALAERQFLAAVKHPNIVSVYNFIRHGGDGFIVMEYVGGKTLKTIRTERGPLPVAEAIAYIHRILNAFAYLHRQGILFCDFKPENFMLEEEDVKLIDMGCVRRMNDTLSPIYGTVGYSAPEASETPSIASDLYTVGRTLSILVAGFDLFGKYVHTLPGPEDVSVFARHPALYAFLQKAVHPQPDSRFQSADEMSAQLLGVLREVTAGTVPPRPIESLNFFSGDQFNAGQAASGTPAAAAKLLPSLKPDPTDPASAALMTASSLDGDARLEALQQALDLFPDSIEVPIRMADIYCDRAEYSSGERLLEVATTRDPFDWRVQWVKGKAALVRNRPAEAIASFESVAADLPGELAPRFALGAAAEASEDWRTAAGWFDVVSRVDPANVVATLSYARCLARLKDTEAAIIAYQRVPPTSNAHQFAQVELARTVLGSTAKPPGLSEFMLVSKTVETLGLEGRTLHEIRSELFVTAVEAIDSGRLQQAADTALLGTPLVRSKICLAAEAALRELARFTASHRERVELVQRANALRPLTWV